MTALTTLDRLKTGERAVVREIRGGHGIRQRLGSLGVHPGDVIEVLAAGFLAGPVLIIVHGAKVAIGRGQAQNIEVEAGARP